MGTSAVFFGVLKTGGGDSVCIQDCEVWGRGDTLGKETQPCSEESKDIKGSGDSSST